MITCNKKLIFDIYFKVKPIVQSLLKPVSTFFYPYKIQVLLFFFVVFGLQAAIAQEKNLIIPDSLLKLSYDELRSRWEQERYGENKYTEVYARAYLQKSKNENSVIENAIGYIMVSVIFHDSPEIQIQYNDSAIAITKNIKHKSFPALFYIYKGTNYDELGNFSKAFENYLEAMKWAKRSQNKNHISILKNNIAILKRKIGKYEEAKSMMKECLIYIGNKKEMRKIDSLSYLVSLSDLVNIYRLNSQIDSALIYNKKGLNSSIGERLNNNDKSIKEKETANLFKLNKAMLYYYEKRYSEVIDGINDVLPDLLSYENRYFFNEYDLITAYLYLGKSYEALLDEKNMVYYYKRIDSLAQTVNYILPETKLAYKKLIQYYKINENRDQQLFYINRLLYADSILDHTYRYLGDKLKKDYDIPQLLVEKEALITDLEAKDNQSSKVILGLSLFSLVLGGFLFWNYRKRKAYTQRFELLMNQTKEEEQKPVQESSKDSDIGISDSIVTEILQKLDDFEQQQGYLKNSLTLNSLAKELKTNANYLSKIVNANKHKSFSHYINDLRIEYVVTQLKSNSTFRKYTVKAIANEIGFKSPDAFSKAFYKSTGIYPSYFIKQLEKQTTVTT
ncbi:AraC family transcriptional regulator [Aquimarina sp. D1M17]|uniref:AraC family transcriptional regulator n=1 Tax=Aquimarina acroporae TaxID=2937283 RepID=UPI0020C15E36|nr:AraC family transcriptional regulator [Aquimarina acroporae]MCK8520823.1 AraC family transcriptional regulator [Aquimarina acroporae]